jgi:flagellar basal body-associated protein FliL
MPPTPDSKKKNSAPIVIVLIVLLLGAGAFLIHRRNQSLAVIDFSVARQALKAGPAPAGAKAAPDSAVPAAQPGPQPAAVVPEKNTGARAGTRYSVSIGPVVCATADTSRHLLQVGVRLNFSDPALEKEINAKRENIERLIKFVFSKKQLVQINAESARAELLDKINAFLTSGRADDLIFTAFDILPMEMK